MNQGENETLLPETPQKPRRSFAVELIREIALFVLVVFAIFYVIRPYLAEPYLVDGRSMDPTFATGDYLIVDKLSYRLKSPERNSVIVFQYPNDTKKNFIKRIIGLPGETVIVGQNSVTIINEENPEGFVLEQPYVFHTSSIESRVTLSDDEYFVMGDNRAESFDSRSWGPLQKKYLLGRPFVRLLPVSELDMFPGHYK